MTGADVGERVYRVDEGVRGLDVAEGGVQRQAEADGVVQARLEANGSGKNHQPEGASRKHTCEVVWPLATAAVAADYLEPGCSEIIWWSSSGTVLMQRLSAVIGPGLVTVIRTSSHWSGSCNNRAGDACGRG